MLYIAIRIKTITASGGHEKCPVTRQWTFEENNNSIEGRETCFSWAKWVSGEDMYTSCELNLGTVEIGPQCHSTIDVDHRYIAGCGGTIFAKYRFIISVKTQKKVASANGNHVQQQQRLRDSKSHRHRRGSTEMRLHGNNTDREAAMQMRRIRTVVGALNSRLQHRSLYDTHIWHEDISAVCLTVYYVKFHHSFVELYRSMTYYTVLCTYRTYTLETICCKQ